ncbi:hypothetical protein B0H14DRAFT_2586510 [Mycena olivaceomarginata]|nr:hypothetical protein B0H14DRAFT_2586510 [Mycena olivaceomarginata]
MAMHGHACPRDLSQVLEEIKQLGLIIREIVAIPTVDFEQKPGQIQFDMESARSKLAFPCYNSLFLDREKAEMLIGLGKHLIRDVEERDTHRIRRAAARAAASRSRAREDERVLLNKRAGVVLQVTIGHDTRDPCLVKELFHKYALSGRNLSSGVRLSNTRRSPPSASISVSASAPAPSPAPSPTAIRGATRTGDRLPSLRSDYVGIPYVVVSGGDVVDGGKFGG